jgi:hypothetical protein
MSEHGPFDFGDDAHDAGGFEHADPFDSTDHGLSEDHGLTDYHWSADHLDDHGGMAEGHTADHTAEHLDDHTAGHPVQDPHSADELPESLLGHEPADSGADHIDDVYPPHLEVAISPTDGQEWVDPGLLGDDHGDLEQEQGPSMASSDELLGSLHAVDGSDGEPSWDAAHNSDDPAVRSLAAFWDPSR